MRVTFNQNPFTNNFYNEKPKENALLMDKRKVSRKVAIRLTVFLVLSAPHSNGETTAMLRPTCQTVMPYPGLYLWV